MIKLMGVLLLKVLMHVLADARGGRPLTGGELIYGITLGWLVRSERVLPPNSAHQNVAVNHHLCFLHGGAIWYS